MDVIVFDRVTKAYRTGFRKRKTALHDFSLLVREGEVFGFLGPNGAGKSTAIKTLVHLIFPTSGKVSILGHPAADVKGRQAVGYLPENPYFYDYLNPLELLRFAGRTSGMGAAAIAERSEALLRRLGLWEERKRPIRSYSKGMVQRVGMALALIHDPRVVVLDEPMTGLDPLGRRQFIDFILELKAAGKTVFFSSHILADVERVCDRVGILVGGRLARLIDLQSEQLEKPLEEIFIDEAQALGGVSR
jgi:ABC-2 type transport system ATP-binding protein